ncbi:DUF7662 domain-containing protein [Desulfosporosinus hippei]|uniref:DUF7662 domain-containing protein n=1 Tax=Desulfosporosinus hippei DSM 8344 TaxID=1121419 RepID=A0A1G7Z4R4_9FIRM|nr:hypothetical protein [Desulfosporosinus hippei]SDH03627.1 hypothetical protein SAMN05443529_1096 [Desulfosporosinus hippei DSM 8344]
MDKYRPLQQFLEKCKGQTVTLTYEQMEGIIGGKLPMSAHKYPAWWANGGHYYADSWLEVGWRVDEVRFSESVTFKKQ